MLFGVLVLFGTKLSDFSILLYELLVCIWLIILSLVRHFVTALSFSMLVFTYLVCTRSYDEYCENEGELQQRLAVALIGKPTHENLIIGAQHFGEIDLIYLSRKVLALVEVKASNVSKANRQVNRYTSVFEQLRPDLRVVGFKCIKGDISHVTGNVSEKDYRDLPPKLLEAYLAATSKPLEVH